MGNPYGGDHHGGIVQQQHRQVSQSCDGKVAHCCNEFGLVLFFSGDASNMWVLLFGWLDGPPLGRSQERVADFDRERSKNASF